MSTRIMGQFPPINPGAQRGNITRSMWHIEQRLMPRAWAEMDKRDKVKLSFEFRARMLKGEPHRRYAPLFQSPLRAVVLSSELPDPAPADAVGAAGAPSDLSDASPSESDLAKWSELADGDDDDDDDDSADSWVTEYYLTDNEDEAAPGLDEEDEHSGESTAEATDATGVSSVVEGEVEEK